MMLFPDLTNYNIRTQITQLYVDSKPCPWCIANAGELCYNQDSAYRTIWKTHIARFQGSL